MTPEERRFVLVIPPDLAKIQATFDKLIDAHMKAALSMATATTHFERAMKAIQRADAREAQLAASGYSLDAEPSLPHVETICCAAAPPAAFGRYSGPMCGLAPGHEGEHVSTSGRWRWSDMVAEPLNPFGYPVALALWNPDIPAREGKSSRRASMGDDRRTD